MRPLRILLQSTIAASADDWDIGRFGLLANHLASWCRAGGEPACEVVARNREPTLRDEDPVLRELARSRYDELWLFAADAGHGLSASECQGIQAFHEQGRGILTCRDHQDLGASLHELACAGSCHFFHDVHPEPDESRRAADDVGTPGISWPNYHSGRNGNLQEVILPEPRHELMRNPRSPSGWITRFPAHPHEGAVGVPAGVEAASVVAEGTSQTTRRRFNLITTMDRARGEHGLLHGRIIAHSSFHHLCDYNWDLSRGAPSFVTDPTGQAIERDPHALDDVKAYVYNAASWLVPSDR